MSGETDPRFGLGERYAVLIALAVFGGALSGISESILLIRGAVLFGGLALALPLINTLCRRHLNAGKRPPWMIALPVAAVAGCLIGGVLNCFALTRNSLATPVGVPVIVLAVAYAMAIHGVYALRWTVRLRWVVGLLPIAVACVAACRGEIVMAGDDFIGPAVVLVLAMAGFLTGLIWLLLMWLFDPAFTLERWQRLNGLAPAPEAGAVPEEQP